MKLAFIDIELTSFETTLSASVSQTGNIKRSRRSLKPFLFATIRTEYWTVNNAGWLRILWLWL
jgi:hypothetical protein